MNVFTYLDMRVTAFNKHPQWMIPYDRTLPIRHWKNIRYAIWVVAIHYFQLSDVEGLSIDKKVLGAIAQEKAYIELNPEFAPYTCFHNNRMEAPRNMTIHFRWAIVKDYDGIEYISVSTRLGNRKER